MSVLGIGVDLVEKDESGSHETMKRVLSPTPGFLVSRLVVFLAQ